MKIKFNQYGEGNRRPISTLLKHLSPSALEAYKSCPKAFYYKYIAKIQLPQKQIHLLFGEAFHKVLEISFEGHDLETALFRFGQEFDMAKLGKEEWEDHAKMLPMGKAMVENYYKNKDALIEQFDLKNGKSEQWLKAVLEDPFTKEELPIPMIGKVDRITDDEQIVEFKTSGGRWNEKEAQQKLQTITYGWLHYQITGRHPKRILYIIFTKQKTPQIQIIEANHLLEDYSKLFHEYKNIINKVELGIFDKSENYHQSFCDCFKYEEALS